MAKKITNDDDYDLNDPEMRAQLRNPREVGKAAMAGGLVTGLGASIIGGLPGFFMIPSFLKAYKSQQSGNFFQKFASAVKNKPLTALVVLPAALLVTGGVYGYLSSKSWLKNATKELDAREQNQARVSASAMAAPAAADPDAMPGNVDKPSWVERTSVPAQDIATSPAR